MMAALLQAAVRGRLRTVALFCSRRQYSVAVNSDSDKKGLVLGVYSDENNEIKLTFATQKYNNETNGKLLQQLQDSGALPKKGEARVLFSAHENFPSIAVVNLGDHSVGFNREENVDEKKENIRTAVAAGCRQLQDLKITKVVLDGCDDAEAAAEGAVLSLWSFQELKSKDKHKVMPELCLSEGSDGVAWEQGLIKAKAQNFARCLMETPANFMTPTAFAQNTIDVLGKLGVQVEVRDESWAESKKMGAFLSVAKGSSEPPIFLELAYHGGRGPEPALALVGKGVTFDSGGINLKSASSMENMRGDMGGAACVVGALRAVAELKLPISVRGYIPLCENLPSGRANKQTDVVTAMNGKTIQIDNTDAEGRLILADALCYAEASKPKIIMDIATLTGAAMVALGGSATAVVTNADDLWQGVERAGIATGDRMWRLPLWKIYSKAVKDAHLADLTNSPKSARAGCSLGGAFLREFVKTKQWLHLDIASVMYNTREVPYLGKGMSGRPTRTIVEFITQLSEEDKS